MAENDIYGSKKKYDSFKANLDSFLIPPNARKGSGKYYCKNRINLGYFKRLFVYFEAKDLSYIRRLRICQTMKFIAHAVTIDLADCDRDDVNIIMAQMHNTYTSQKSKETFIKDIKHIWKLLFTDLDEKGRPDETIIPYTVRHLSARIDKSKQKLRKDKFTIEEFEQIINYFSNDPRIQAYLTISLESLARPQELLYLKIEDVELYDNYAKLYISEHGKEGVGLLQCIDSYPYLLKWLELHPLKNNKKAFLFVNTGNTNTCKQLKPSNINKFIRKACKDLEIDKPITCYSLKRNGVTIRRLRGESDMEIQHAARWMSTKQLKTYDLSVQDEAFKLALQKRGILQPDKNTTETFASKQCPFCTQEVGFGEIICPKCKHSLNRSTILNEKQKDEQINSLQQTIDQMKNQFANIKQELMQEMMEQILKIKNTETTENKEDSSTSL